MDLIFLHQTLLIICYAVNISKFERLELCLQKDTSFKMVKLLGKLMLSEGFLKHGVNKSKNITYGCVWNKKKKKRIIDDFNELLHGEKVSDMLHVI